MASYGTLSSNPALKFDITMLSLNQPKWPNLCPGLTHLGYQGRMAAATVILLLSDTEVAHQLIGGAGPFSV